MATKVANNAWATLAAGINASVTSIVLTTGQGARFPALTGGDYFWATLTNASNTIEVIKVTAVATDTLTVVRGQDGTTGQAYLTGDKIEIRPVAALFNDKLDATTAAATYQPVLGFVPVQQGTGIGQNANTVKLGDSATGLKATVNGVDQGLMAFQSWVTSTTNAATTAALNSALTAYVPKLGTTSFGQQTISTNGIPLVLSNNTGDLQVALQTNGTSRSFIGANPSYPFHIVDVTGTVDFMHLDASGNMTILGALAQGSDERLKKNWEPLRKGFLTQLAKVKTGTYQRKDMPARVRDLGVSAQSLKAVLPEAVHSDCAGMLSVSYGNAALVACVELAREVKALKAALKALKAQVAGAA